MPLFEFVNVAYSIDIVASNCVLALKYVKSVEDILLLCMQFQ